MLMKKVFFNRAFHRRLCRHHIELVFYGVFITQ